MFTVYSESVKSVAGNLSGLGASDAASGTGRRETRFNRTWHAATQPISWWAQKERGRLGHRETTSPELTARSAVNVPRLRKHRGHEEPSGVPVSEANGSKRDAVSRGRGMPSNGRALLSRANGRRRRPWTAEGFHPVRSRLDSVRRVLQNTEVIYILVR